MSIDRINNDKGHPYENCRLVCLAIQLGKNNKSDEKIKKHLELMKNSNKGEIIDLSDDD